MSITVIYPRLSDILPLDRVPDGVEGLQEAIAGIFDDLFVKDLFVQVSKDGSSGYYSLKILSFNELGITLPFTGGTDDMKLIINPAAGGTSELDVIVDYSWAIIKYLKQFSLDSFDNSLRSILEIFYSLAKTSQSDLLKNVIIAFIPEANAIQSLITKINTDYNTSITYSPDLSDDKQLEQVIEDLVNYNLDLISVITQSFIEGQGFSEGLARIKELFNYLIEDVEQNLKEAIKLYFTVQLSNLSLGLQFPRKWLQPVYDGSQPVVDENGNPIALEINDPLPENYRTYLTFTVGSLIYSTESGLQFYKQNSFDLNRSMIGNTGIIIDFDNLKVDLSNDSNIPEAELDGRPANFKGVYAETALITLPSKWFKEDSENPSTLQIRGTNILVGTGGISGEIALEAVGGDNILWKKIGSENGFRVGFSSFDIIFKQNKVVHSSIKGALQLNGFEYPAGHVNQFQTVNIMIDGHIEDNGVFELTATVQEYPIRLPDVFIYHLKTVSLGREGDGDFYLETSGILEFEGILRDILNLNSISIDKLRIYSDGTMEFSGGGINLIEPIVLPLGPVEITVTAIHYGSHQKEINGEMVKFNYFGFDGGLSVDPLGVEIRGDGVKFYYCVDNPSLNYLHIQTVYLDLTIPASTPVAIIRGWLSIPEPGTSPEYKGGMKIELPKAKITGSADMKLAPKYPAFTIDADFEFPAPIPLGSFAIYGFRGLLGYRYIAEKEAIGLVSHDDSWYDYYKKPPRGIHVEKFSGPNQTTDAIDAFSIGAGASLGTSFDNGTVLNIKAMVLLSVPSMFMIDGRAALLSARLGLDSTNDPPFFAYVVLEENSIEFGFGADFKMPSSSGSMLKLYAQIQAAFFFNNPSNWYIHIGTPDNRVTAEIVSLVTLKSYLMLSSRGIEAGARGELNFDRTYAGIIKVRAWAYIEVGGKISFERPQFGAYLDAGVGAEINVKFVHLSAAFQILFGVEASEPFLIYGRVRISISIRIIWVFKFSFDAEVEVMWEKSKTVNRRPINPLINEHNLNAIGQLVKGVNMLSNETFKLDYLGAAIPGDLPSTVAQTIIPLDTYIDIKTEKGLLPGGISAQIGGYNNPPSRYKDLVPPDKIIRGKELRQVKHQYSIEKLQVKIWNPSGHWDPYHPYEALYPDDFSLNSAKIGQFQKTDGQYNTVRLLATTPFSYTEQGQPGWYIPEQYGLTSGSIFCEAEQLTLVCANFLNKPLNQQYYCFDLNHMFYANEAAFLLIDKEDDEYAYISDHPNIFHFDQSLAFGTDNKLQIILPEPSVQVNLKLTSYSMGVRIRYFAPLMADSELEVQYGNPDPSAGNQSGAYTVTVNAANLNQVITYNKPGWRAVTKIIIEPVESMPILLANVNNQLAFLQNQNTRSALNLFPNVLQPLIPLQNEIAYLRNRRGSLEVNSFAFNPTQNEYRVGQGKDWVTSWDTKNNRKVPGNVIGFTLKDDTLVIESDYQLMDFRLIPDDPKAYFVENEGFNTRIVTKDIGKFINQDGNIELDVTYYENCRKDYKLCDLGGKLEAVRSNYLPDPANVKGTDFKLINPYFSRALDTISAFDKKNPDYGLARVYEQQTLAIQDHLKQSTIPTYTIAHGAIVEVITDLSVKGTCDCKEDCNETGELCVLYQSIQNLLKSCITSPFVTKEDSYTKITTCVEQLLSSLYDFDSNYPKYGIIEIYNAQLVIIRAFIDHNDPATYQAAYNAIQNISAHLAIQGNCDCGKTLELLENLYNSIKEILEGQLGDPGSIKDYSTLVPYIVDILELIQEFDVLYPGLDLAGNLQQYINILNEFISNPNQNNFDQAVIAIGHILDQLNQIGDFQIAALPNTTLLHEVCWLSLESYQYNQNIPSQEAISEDVQATIDGIQRYIQPVWRPNSSYIVHFELKDTVDDGDSDPGVYPYTYGFSTAGPVGYFHKHPNANYGNPDPDTFALTSLRRYIDYERSYPNADGNLLSSKPLFYDDTTTQIYLFFTKAYAVHFFDSWQAYNGNPAVSGRLKIVIKDPVEGTEVVNPPYLDYDEDDVTTIDIPQTVEQWLDDENPLLNNAISQWINLYNSNNCVIVGADPIRPASRYVTIALKHLKPEKLYTAIVNNLHGIGPDSAFSGADQRQEVHKFVFQTSRYANFQEQVQSYKLTESDGDTVTVKEAIFNIDKDFTAQEIENAYKTITGEANPADSLILQYQHAYDRIFEGVFGFSPVDPPVSTEFNRIRNAADNNKVVALIIRNPEPFNIPKIPLVDIQDTVQVFVNGQLDTSYKVLHSKDYSQVILMHSSHRIDAVSLEIRFKFKIWDGFSYLVSDIQTVEINLVD